MFSTNRDWCGDSGYKTVDSRERERERERVSPGCVGVDVRSQAPLPLSLLSLSHWVSRASLSLPSLLWPSLLSVSAPLAGCEEF